MSRYVFVGRCSHENTDSVYAAVSKKLHEYGCVMCDVLGASMSDLSISIGGDGTFIDIAKSNPKAEIFGINKGTLGYLADVEESDAAAAIDSYFNGDYWIQERMMLDGYTSGSCYQAFQNIVNDVVVMKKDSSVIRLEIYVNNILITSYYADGVIVSTPTGATGYALSCGAPIVDPASEMILITPVAPHTIMSRSLCVALSSRIQIVPVSAKGGQDLCSVELDGKRQNLAIGSVVNIKASSNKLKTVRFDKHSFLDRIMKKMGGVK